MRNLLLGGILFCSLVSQPLLYAQKKTEAPKYIKNIEGVKEYSLNNGLKVLLIPDASQSNMIVNIVYNVGSRNEGYGEKGMAHLLEHMLFKSTKNLGDIKKMLSDKGGNANGTTWLDRTNYYEIFPSNDENLKWSIQMEADRMVNSTILQTDLDKEFSVVRNEFEIGENNPDAVLQERILSAAYLWHNYGRSTIGSKEDIERVRANTLRVFYEKYYQPDNSTLIIAGKFDEQKALQYVGQYFGAIPKPKRVLDKTYTIEPAQDGEKYVELNRAGDSKNVGAVYHTAAYADKDYAAIDALGEILTADPSGYLYKTLVETQKASSIYFWQPTTRDASYIYFGVAVPNDKDVKATKDIVRTELDKIGSTKYTDEDVSRAKAKIIKQIESVKNNTVSFAINLTEIIGAGDYRLGFLYRDAIEKLTKEDIQRVAEKYFRSNNRTVGVFIPSKDEQRVKPAEYTDEQLLAFTKEYKGKALEKEAAPFEASIKNLKQNFVEGKLSNGAKYGLIKKEIKGGKVQASFKFQVSNEKDLKGKTNAGGILAQLLKTGTKTKTKEQIQDRLDQLKSSIDFNYSRQTLSVNVSTYKENFKEVMAILGDLLVNATFPENELTKTISEYNTYLEANLNDPQSVAFTEINRQTTKYPKESIFYTLTIQEQIDAFKKIKQAEIVDFYSNILGGNNGVGTVVGDLDAKSTGEILENTFGKWNSKSKYELALPTYFESEKSDKDLITPDKENAVALGRISFKMDRKSPDYPAFVMANEILGSGGFLSARIPMRLREKEGISYGAGSFIDVPITSDVAFWSYYAFLNPTKKKAVETAAKEEIAKALKDGFTADELKSNLVSWQNERKTRLGTDDTLMSLTNTYLQYGIPLEDYDTLESKVKTLKVEEVNAVLRKYLSLEKMTSIYAGDFNKK
ncbi:zinc protease [Flavobacterium araucananum]|uniref:Peptidase M16 n=1 Tax=Flavobacterium araucananum TaxID=946678 RepID=A0A227PAE1_9FLAO|nr:M16 family metallopeptidase [Flavobacterium araucananum]OXG06218.1 peptidase M16 [Flavobacterium araucananum]PWK00558.1 zinc protease [Flavobacterium araucananum]